MANRKGLSYNEFIELAKSKYNRGGDSYFECWGESEFRTYVEEFGPITKTKALKMFKEEYEMERDRAGYWM